MSGPYRPSPADQGARITGATTSTTLTELTEPPPDGKRLMWVSMDHANFERDLLRRIDREKKRRRREAVMAGLSLFVALLNVFVAVALLVLLIGGLL